MLQAKALPSLSISSSLRQKHQPEAFARISPLPRHLSERFGLSGFPAMARRVFVSKACDWKPAICAHIVFALTARRSCAKMGVPPRAKSLS